jgi:hypothetical protein
MGLNDIVDSDIDRRCGKVPMLALTPKVLEALEDAHGSLLSAHGEFCLTGKCDCTKNHLILERAIAAAQKEAQ